MEHKDGIKGLVCPFNKSAIEMGIIKQIRGGS